MNVRIKSGNYIHLSIQSVCLLLSIKFLTTALHELGHCLGGWIVGLKPVGFYAAVLGGGMSYVLGSRVNWQQSIMSAGGPAMDLVLGSIVLFVLLPRMKKWGAKLFCLFYALVALAAFWVYMVIGGFLNSGDFANLSRIFGVGRYWAGVVGILGMLGFTYIIVRKIFKVLSSYFPLDSFLRRFIVLFLFIGLPGSIYAIGGYLLSPGGHLGQMLLIVAFAVLIPGFLSIFQQESATKLREFPRWPSLAGAAVLGAAVIVWLGVFGAAEARARGILWSAPKEERVSLCNITVLVERDLNIQVDFLMRPYSRYLFWEKIKHQTPDWTVYDNFIKKNVPVLFGISEYQIVERTHDSLCPFYHDLTHDTGARRISLAADLTGMARKNNDGTVAVEIKDFWRIDGGGYIDKLEVILGDDIRLSDHELFPENAKKPDRFDERGLVWENDDSSVPEKIRLKISKDT